MEKTTPTKENNYRTGATGETDAGFRGADYYANRPTNFPTAQPTTSPTATTVTSSSLAPVKPVVLPDAPVSTYGGLPGSLEALTGQAQTQEQLSLDEARNKKDSSMDSYLQAILEQGNISSSVDRTAQDTAKRESDKYRAMLEQEQQAQRKREEAFRTNFTGTTAGASAGLDKLSRDSLSKQADIAILQTAANRDYDTASSIADRAVALKLEQSNANLSALKFFYDENKSAFTKADDRIYVDVVAKKEAENRRLERNETAIAQLKLNVAQYGGGAKLLSQLSAIDTTKADAYDKAIAIAGKFATDPLDRELKRAQIGKINSESGAAGGVAGKQLSDTEYSKFVQTPSYKAINDGSKYQTALTAMKKAIEDFGTREVWNAKGAGALNSAYQSLTAATKDYYNLGTLDNGVEKLIELGIPKPDSFTTRDKKVKSAIDSAAAQANTNITSAVNQLKSSVYGNSVDFQTLVSSSNLGQQLPLTDEEKVKAQADYERAAKESLVRTRLQSTGLKI